MEKDSALARWYQTLASDLRDWLFFCKERASLTTERKRRSCKCADGPSEWMRVRALIEMAKKRISSQPEGKTQSLSLKEVKGIKR